MSTIYRLSDRLTFKIHDTEVTIAPMTVPIKAEMQKLFVQSTQEGDITLITEAMTLGIRHCVKSIKGLSNMDGSDYELTFIEGLLTDECVGDLLNMEYSPELINICTSMVRGSPTKLNDTQGNPLKGVKLITKPAKKRAGKNTKK